MIQQSRPERLITFSSQSIGFKPLSELGFWQTNVVSEDSRIFWQCLLYYDGDWQTAPLFFPVYMDANVGPTFWATIKNQYKQIQRWSYGVENNAYFLFGFWKNNKINKKKKWRLGFVMIEGAHSLATNSLIIFLLGWLPTLIGRGEFSETLLSYNLPYITRLIMTFAMVGLIFTAIIAANLLPPRPPHYGRFKYVWMIFQWFLFPVNMIVFDSTPVLLFVDAVIMAKHSDGVVLVYKAGKMARGALKRSKEQVISGNARMIGVVLNDMRASEMGPHYGYYRDYGHYSRPAQLEDDARTRFGD